MYFFWSSVLALPPPYNYRRKSSPCWGTSSCVQEVVRHTSIGRSSSIERTVDTISVSVSPMCYLTQCAEPCCFCCRERRLDCKWLSYFFQTECQQMFVALPVAVIQKLLCSSHFNHQRQWCSLWDNGLLHILHMYYRLVDKWHLEAITQYGKYDLHQAQMLGLLEFQNWWSHVICHSNLSLHMWCAWTRQLGLLQLPVHWLWWCGLIQILWEPCPSDWAWYILSVDHRFY